MNAGQVHTLESLFGPPSEVIDIRKFLEESRAQYEAASEEEDVQIPSEVADECSVDDIRDEFTKLWNDPSMSCHLTKEHERTVSTLFASASPSSKRSRKLDTPPESLIQTLPAEVQSLQHLIDSVELTCFKLDEDSVHFMRTSKNSDYNVLNNSGPVQTSNVSRGAQDAIITVSIYEKVSWGPSYVTRSSQMAFASSQSLDDLNSSLPCISKGMPHGSTHPGYLIMIERRIYENEGQDDYAQKLLKHLESTKRSPDTYIDSCEPRRNCRFDHLSVRLHEPYWMVHSGNCEHFVVFDQIRLAHPTDPQTGYPFLLQAPPTLLDLCRACTKVPAVWSIVGDVRLGESPCVLCGPCWTSMGASEEDNVLVIPIALPPPLKKSG